MNARHTNKYAGEADKSPRRPSTVLSSLVRLPLVAALGGIGGCTSAGYLCRWHYGAELARIREQAPLIELIWAGRGALIGALITVALLLLLVRRNATAQQPPPGGTEHKE